MLNIDWIYEIEKQTVKKERSKKKFFGQRMFMCWNCDPEQEKYKKEKVLMFCHHCYTYYFNKINFSKLRNLVELLEELVENI